MPGGVSSPGAHWYAWIGVCRPLEVADNPPRREHEWVPSLSCTGIRSTRSGRGVLIRFAAAHAVDGTLWIGSHRSLPVTPPITTPSPNSPTRPHSPPCDSAHIQAGTGRALFDLARLGMRGRRGCALCMGIGANRVMLQPFCARKLRGCAQAHHRSTRHQASPQTTKPSARAPEPCASYSSRLRIRRSRRPAT